MTRGHTAARTVCRSRRGTWARSRQSFVRGISAAVCERAVVRTSTSTSQLAAGTPAACQSVGIVRERVFSAAGKMHGDLQKFVKDTTLQRSLFAAFNME